MVWGAVGVAGVGVAGVGVGVGWTPVGVSGLHVVVAGKTVGTGSLVVVVSFPEGSVAPTGDMDREVPVVVGAVAVPVAGPLLSVLNVAVTLAPVGLTLFNVALTYPVAFPLLDGKMPEFAGAVGSVVGVVAPVPRNVPVGVTPDKVEGVWAVGVPVLNVVLPVPRNKPVGVTPGKLVLVWPVSPEDG